MSAAKKTSPQSETDPAESQGARFQTASAPASAQRRVIDHSPFKRVDAPVHEKRCRPTTEPATRSQRLSLRNPRDMVAVHEAAHEVVSRRLSLDTSHFITITNWGLWVAREVWSGSCHGLGGNTLLIPPTVESLRMTLNGGAKAERLERKRLRAEVMVDMAGLAAELVFGNQDLTDEGCSDMEDVLHARHCALEGLTEPDEWPDVGDLSSMERDDYAHAHRRLSGLIADPVERHRYILNAARQVERFIRRPVVRRAISRLARAIVNSKQKMTDHEAWRATASNAQVSQSAMPPKKVIRYVFTDEMEKAIGYGQDSIFKKAA